MRTLEREDVLVVADRPAAVRVRVPAPREAGGASTVRTPRRVAERDRRRRPATRPAPAVALRPQSDVACAGGAPAQQDSGYRMGRAARLTVTLTVLATAAVLALGWTGAPEAPAGTVTVSVPAGESLWQLAAEQLPSASTSEIGARVEVIRALNGWQDLPVDAALRAGTPVVLPGS